MSTGDDFIPRSGLVWTFIHPECQNLSIISDSIDRAKQCNNCGGTEKSWLQGCEGMIQRLYDIDINSTLIS